MNEIEKHIEQFEPDVQENLKALSTVIPVTIASMQENIKMVKFQ